MSKPLSARVAARRVVRNRTRRWLAEALEGRRMLATTPVLVGDINQTTDQFAPGASVQVGNVAFFAGRPNAADGPELFKTDGTTAGTVLVKDINPTVGSSPSNLTRVGNLLYFAADDGTSGVELWRSDGTAAGTTRVADLSPGLGSGLPSNLLAIGNTLYFTASDGNATTLWQSDGTAAGTTKITDSAGGALSNVATLAASNGNLFFAAGSSSSGRSVYELPSSGGGGAVLIANSPVNVTNLTSFGGYVYFTRGTSSISGIENGDLWRASGLGAQKVAAIDVNASGSTDYATAASLTASGDRLFLLVGNVGSGAYDLWSTDGTPGVAPIHLTTNAPFSRYSTFAPIGARSVLFTNTTTSTGREPWVSDGTVAGTTLLKDLAPGTASGATYLTGLATLANGRSLFTTSAAFGLPIQIWTTDGTAANTVQGATIRTAAGVGYTIGSLNGVALVNGERGVGEGDLYRSDATAVGTYRLGAAGIGTASSLAAYASSYGAEFTAIGNAVYFAASDGATGYELWRIVGDGTPQRVVDLATDGADAAPANVTAGGDGSVYFTINPPAGTRTAGVYWIDKTGKLTVVPISPPDGTVVSGSLVAFGNRLLFKMTAGGQYARAQLWLFDPAVGHAQPVIADSSYLDPSNVVVANGYALFGAVEFSNLGADTSKQRLFRLGASATAAELVTTFAASANGYTLSPSPVGVGGALAYFEIDTASTGDELYAVSTVAGGGGGATTASLVSDLSPGSASTDFNLNAPQSTIYAAGVFYFSAQTSSDSAYRVYRTDGTAAGTRAIGVGLANGNDLSVDAPSFVAINDGTNVGTTVYFVGKFGTNPEPLLCLITGDGSLYNDGRYSEFVPYALIGAADAVYAIGLGGANHDRFDLWRMAGINAGAPALVATLGPKVTQQVGGDLLSFWNYGRYAMAATDTNLFFPWYTAATGIEPGRLALAATPEPHMQTGTVAEGGTMQVSGADIAYSSPEDRLRYEWDFDYDGATFDVDATGSETIFSAANIDGPATRTIALRITNGGNRSAITTGTVTIDNAAPTATLTATAGHAGANSTFSFSNVVDPGVADTAAGFTYSFDLNGDGDFTDPGEVDRGTSPTIAYAFATPGQYTVNGRVYDKDGDYRQYRRAVTVDAAPTPAPPTKVGFDNYGSVVEGSSTTLYGHATVGSGQSIAKWEYDFDYDGKTFDVDATGQLPTFVAPDGPATRTIAIRVTDNYGQSVIAAQTLGILNADPTATFKATSVGNAVTATFSNATDASAADRAAGFTYSFDFNNDGDFTDPGDVLNATSPTASYTFAAAGAHAIEGRIVDKDVGFNYYATSVTSIAPPPTNVYFDAPTFKEGGPQTFLAGHAATVPGQSIVKYEWDFNYVNGTFTTDYASSPIDLYPAGASYDYSTIDGPASPTIAVRVTDNFGQTAIGAQVVSIPNVPPTATLSSTASGSVATATFGNATDPSAADRAAGFKYSFDFNNDGDFTDPGEVSNSTSPTASFTYPTAGTYAIHGRIADKDGGYTDYTTNVAINVTRPGPPTNVGFTAAGLVGEGHLQTLTGFASVASGQSIVKWEYDLNYDGKTFNGGVTNQTTTFDATNIDGPTTRLIAIRVTDNYGQVAVGSQSLTILNIAPMGTLTVVPGTVAGTAVATFTKVGDDGNADRAAGFTYSFDFNNDGDFTDPGEVDRGTSPTATGTYAAAGTYTVLGRVYDKDGDYTKYFANVTVTAPPPAVAAPVPSFTNAPLYEGGIVLLNGSATVAPGRSIAKYEYDFNYDGKTFFANATAQNAYFSAANIDGPATRQVAIRATDSGGLVGLTVQTVTILNAAPTGYFSVVANANGSATATFTGATDASAADVAAGLTYSFDFNGNSVFTDPGDVLNGKSPTATFAYAATGDYGITARITDKDGSYALYGQRISITVPTTPTPAQLTGTAIGTAGSFGNGGNTIAKAFDGSLTTFFDAPVATGAWGGLDLGSAKVITSARFSPRAGYATRMVGGLFQGSSSADFTTGVVTLATIAGAPAEGYTTLAVTNPAAFRYVRYLGPAKSYGDVAELAFFGAPGTTTPPPVTPPTTGTLTGTAIGTSGSFGNSGNTIARAFDGSLSTFVDLAAANGGWAGLDLGVATTVTSIRYAPRAGWSSRMVNGIFQGSTSADFSTGVVTLATITTRPTDGVLTSVTSTTAVPYRYVRYLSPAGSFGDVAEVQFVGAGGGTTTPPVITPPPTTPAPPTKFTGTTIGTPGSFLNGGNTIANATDNELASFFDGPSASGNWVGLDLGTARTILQVSYSPRPGYASRMLGGIFQGSNSPDFSSASTLLTITQAPVVGDQTYGTVANATAFRYVRYLAPAGSYGDVAEVGFYG